MATSTSMDSSARRNTSLERVQPRSSLSGNEKGSNTDDADTIVPPAAETESMPEVKREETNEEVVYPGSLNLAFICLGLFLTVICTGLDRSIITTAIPKITADFNSLDDVAWYGSAYLLGTCCFQLFFGKLYAEFSVKWVFLAGLLIFEVGSVVCAAAPSSVALIVGRAIAGIGVAGFMSGALIIIARSVPLHNRPKYSGAMGGAFGIAQVIAPTLGGAFTDKLTWRWCFWINLPLGGVTFFTILFLVSIPPDPKAPATGSVKSFIAKFDLFGTLLLMPWVICLLLALQWGGSLYSWNSWRIILLLVLFSVLFVAWLVVQFLAGDRATAPFRIIRQRSMAAGLWFMFFISSAFFILVYFVPIWFQAVRGVTALQSGINFLAASAAMSVAVICAGFLTSRIGYYVPPMIASTILSSVGTGLVYTFDRETSTAFWAGALVVFGLGIGFGLQQPLMACQTVFKGSDIALSMSALIFTQTIAGAILLSVAQNIFQTQLKTQLHDIVPEVNLESVIRVGASDLVSAMKKEYPQYIDGILTAYNNSLQRVFLIGVVLACLTVFGAAGMEWTSVKSEKKAKEKKQQEEAGQREMA